MKTFGELSEIQEVGSGSVFPVNNAEDTATNKITYANLKNQMVGTLPASLSISGTTITITKVNGTVSTIETQDSTYSASDGVILDGDRFKADLKSFTRSSLAASDMGSTSNRQYAVGLDTNGDLSVNVPWENDNTTYTGTDGVIIDDSTIKADIKSNTKSALTAAAKGNTADREYAVGLDSAGDLSVNVPWTDTTYTASTGAKIESGVIKADLKSATASTLTAASMGSTADRQYAVGLDANGNLSVNVPWENDNTTYTASTGTKIESGVIKADLKSATPSALTAATRGNTADREYAVGLDANGNLSVNVPWANNTYTASTGAKIENGVVKTDLKSDTQSSLTAAAKGNTADREYAVGLDANGNLSVNVPWENIVHHATDGIIYANHDFSLDLQTSTKSALTAATRGAVADREYPVGLDANGNLSVNVPWVNTNIIHTASDGIIYQNENFSLNLKSTALSALTAAAKGTTANREYAVGLDANGNLSVNIPWDDAVTYSTGTSSTAGITKLYSGTGSNTDGTMTQAAITAALGNVVGNAYIVTNSLPTYGDGGKVYLIPCDEPGHTEKEQYIWINDGGTTQIEDPENPGQYITVNTGAFELIGTTDVDLSGYYTSTETDSAISTALGDYNPGVTSIVAGTGLSGGTITSTGTIALAGSGVTAGSYGPSADVSGTNGTTLSVPQYAIDSYGRVTGVTNRTYTSVDTTYTASTGIVLDSGQFKANLKSTTASELTAAIKGTTANREYAVGLDANGNLSVNVPWENDNTTYTASTGVVLDNGVFKADLKSSVASALTAASMGSTADKQYAVGLDANGDLSVNIPWTDTTYTASTGAKIESGVIKADLKSAISSTLTAASMGLTADRQYAVGLDANDNLSVNIPWTDTTYTADDGVVLDNGVFKADLKSSVASALTATSMGSTADRQYAVGLDANDNLSVNIPWTDTTYTPAKLGFGYGTCTTSASATAKTVTIANYVPMAGGIVTVQFVNAFVNGDTLEVSDGSTSTSGACDICYAGTAVATGMIIAGSTVTMMFDGTNFNIISILPIITPFVAEIDAAEEQSNPVVEEPEEEEP